MPKALPQLQSRERAAHTGTVSEQCLEPNRARFLRQLKRISVLMDSVVRVSPPQPRSRLKLEVRRQKVKSALIGIAAGTWRPAWLQPASPWLPALSLQLG